MKLALLLAAAAGAAVASASKILLVGDSWAEKAGTPLAEVLKKHGSPLQVVNKGIGGSTAAQWAENPDKVRTLVELNGGKDIEFIWVSLGGNDAQAELPGCQIAGGTPDECVAKTIAQVLHDTAKILDPVVAEFPAVKIFQFGYDILNVRCVVLARARLRARLSCPFARPRAHVRVLTASSNNSPLSPLRVGTPLHAWAGRCHAADYKHTNQRTQYPNEPTSPPTNQPTTTRDSSARAWSARRWAWRCSPAAWISPSASTSSSSSCSTTTWRC